MEQNTALLSTYVGDTIKLCNTAFCTKTSLASVTKTVKNNTKRLYNLTKVSQNAMTRACGQKGKSSGRDKSRALLTSTQAGIQQVPSVRCD